MDLTLCVLPPDGRSIPRNLGTEIARVLNRAEVAYEIEENLPEGPRVHLVDTSDVECRFIVRLFQRAGYNVEIVTP